MNTQNNNNKIIKDMETQNNKYERLSVTSDVKIYANNKKGILLISDNKFLMRLWFLISNPFRYVFTGHVRY